MSNHLEDCSSDETLRIVFETLIGSDFDFQLSPDGTRSVDLHI